MQWYTAAISQWRKVKAANVELFDITVKSGDQRFAPEPDVLWAYKRGEVTDEEYTERYTQKLRSLFIREPSAFEDLLNTDTPKALACYCRAGKFCHRHLLLTFLQELAEDNEISFVYAGEIL